MSKSKKLLKEIFDSFVFILLLLALLLGFGLFIAGPFILFSYYLDNELDKGFMLIGELFSYLYILCTIIFINILLEED